MDPPAMMNDGLAFNFPEIWQYPMNGNGRGQFGQGLSQFGNSGSEPVTLEHRVSSVRKRRDVEDDSVKAVSTSNDNGNSNGMNDYDGKRLKVSPNKDENGDSKTKPEPSSDNPVEQNNKSAEPPKQDYIHVRARRGQATDSHSLAERARREKISERMKILQDLVPGCDKVIGKALVLDEIINYIQSLQRQVEFLSMKLEAVNTRITPGIEVFPSKDFGQRTFDGSGMGLGSQAPREYSRGTSPEWLHMQIGGGFERPS